MATGAPPSPSERTPLPDAPIMAVPDVQLQRSCKTCRKRKVKCNKEQPCSNCIRHKIPCVYPDVVERPPKVQKQVPPKVATRRPEKKDLMKRLQHLESLVGTLSTLTRGTPNEIQPSVEDEAIKPLSASLSETLGNPNVYASPQTDGVELGSLLLKDGKSIYVNNFFWANLTSETKQIRNLLEDCEEDDEPYLDQPFAYITKPCLLSNNTIPPLPSQVPFYWQTYVKNVDPVVKVLHRPTTYDALCKAEFCMERLSSSMQAMLYAICFAAVLSLNPDEVRLNFAEDKMSLLRKHRQGIELSLVKAEYLTTQDIVTLQALVLYLICARAQDNRGHTYAMVGIVTCIAQNLGLHRDGSNFGLSPYDTELRRRVWWQVAGLDTCTALSVGSDPKIFDTTYNTELPLNLNDEDFGPHLTSPLRPRVGMTDMSFRLIKDELYPAMRQLAYVPAGEGKRGMAAMTLAEKEEMVRETHKRVEEKYLQYLNTSDPMSWVVGTMGRLMMSRMWLVLYHPYYTLQYATSDHKQDPVPSTTTTLPLGTRRKLLATSIQILEYAHFLETDASAQRWQWLFRIMTQWHAIALTLCELTIDPGSPLADRGWKAIDASFAHRDVASPKTGRLWKLMGGLMDRARESRDRHLAHTMHQTSISSETGASWPSDVPSTTPLHGTETSPPLLGFQTTSPSTTPHTDIDVTTGRSFDAQPSEVMMSGGGGICPRSGEFKMPDFDWAAWSEMVRTTHFDAEVANPEAAPGTEGWWA